MNLILDSSDEPIFHQNDLIELEPYGVSLGLDGQKPALILRDREQVHTIMVPMNPIDAGIAMTQASPSAVSSGPHTFLRLLIESLQIKPAQCVFVQHKNGFQYVRIYLTGHPQLTSLKLSATDAMSICLHFKLPLYATRDFVRMSKEFTLESLNVQKLNPQMSAKNRQHMYLM